MQNGIAYSSLLQNYLANSGIAPNTVATQSYAQTPQTNPNAQLLQQPAQDTFSHENDEEKAKKGNIAKAALVGGMVIAASAILIAAFRNNGGFIKTIKGKVKNIAGFLNPENVKKGAAEAQTLAAGADNITNVKDITTRKFLGRIPGYKKFDSFFTNFYQNTILKTMKGSYKKAQVTLDAADDAVIAAIKQSGKNDKASQRILELIGKRKENLGNFTSADAVAERFGKLNESMSDLSESGWQRIKGFIKGKDPKKAMETLSKESIVKGGLEKSKGVQEGLLKSFQSCGLSTEEAKELDQLMSTAFSETNPQLLKQTAKAKESLQKAFGKESKDLFLKLRDINCGSAPTDIEGMALTMGTLGIYAAQADSKEERVGVTLTTGVPLLATLGTTLIATCNMISGVRALGLGATAGFAVKTICGAINKKYQEKHAQNGQPATKTIVTLDDYLQTIKDMKSKVYNS